MIKYYLLIFLLPSALLAYAQDDDIDPLNNPSIWAQLVYEPQDNSLWELYLEKPTTQFNDTDKINIQKWKMQLQIEKIALDEALLENQNKSNEETFDDDFWATPATENTANSRVAAEMQVEEERVAAKRYMEGLEEAIVTETNEVSILKENIIANFAIIEDIYFEEFSAYGLTYTYYHEVHPDGNFSEEQWIADKDEEIRNLKGKEFESLKLAISAY